MNLGQMVKIGRCSVLTIILLAIACCATTGGHINPPRQQESMVQKDINAALRDHEKELLAIPGVVGVRIPMKLAAYYD